MKDIAKEKKNGVLKNISLALKAWFRRYPSAWILVPIYLAIRIASPFVNTLIPSLAIRSPLSIPLFLLWQSVQSGRGM